MQKVGTVQGTRSGMGIHLGLGGCICQQVWRMVWLGEPPTSCCRISEIPMRIFLPSLNGICFYR